VPVGYAAVGGFNNNTPTTPGHVFRVACAANCASFTWQDKSGNLPDIPVDSVIVNPNFPQQVYAGTDFGLYFTNDINAATPTWYRFANGIPNVMVWDLQIDRGSTTLSVWTRSRGAYVWQLPNSPYKQNQTIDFAPLGDKTYGDPDFTVSATATSGLAVTFAASGNCTVTGDGVHITGAGSCTITASQAGNLDWNPAPDVPRTFTINKADQTIDFGPLGNKTLGDPDFTIGATASSGLPVSFSAVGSCSVSGTTVHITGVGLCTVTASQAGDDNYNPAPDVSQGFYVFWPFSGFFSPVDNPPTLNVANAGSAIPVKFALGGDRGLAILAAGYPVSTRFDCSSQSPQDDIEQTVTAGQSSLNYGGSQYTYVWKTDRAWAGTCRELQVKLVDGSTHTAWFKFR
jgi:hypothetical protein